MHTIIFYIIIGLLVVGLFSVIIAAYNRLVMLKNNVNKAFFNIDVLLKQRADEIPDLIKVVKESMHYEETMLTRLTQLRTDFLNSADREDRLKLSNEMERMVKSIFAVSENYPDLKANSNFSLLQQRVSGIEDAIADRREFYNESVNMYNIGIAEFPPLILAKLLGYQEKQLLQISASEKKYDGVQF
ncbi:LemA family protein [Chitinophaga sp. XS-30]|uniref:LemA family protein n=1 Tax=Chitinophaga sp. XS-30 TaxID=2604421 RepID=UPI0011DE28B9|nr:LemA family protein [Chitinophaga sp. XS-30]QEH43245.1 LemA family protein [Chitinophaga sp. XS-30]